MGAKILTSLNRDSGSSTPWNSSERPKRTMKSWARSKANFLASPRMDPWDRRSNSGRLLLADIRGKKEGNKGKIPSEKTKLLFGVSFRQTRLVYPGIARHLLVQGKTENPRTTRSPTHTPGTCRVAISASAITPQKIQNNPRNIMCNIAVIYQSSRY